MDKCITETVRRMQKRLESLSGYRVCYERIPALKRIATDQQGTYRFDRSKGHIIGLYEEGDGFDELRAAMEVSHGLLFFDGYPGVLGSPGEVCALVTDTIQHPAMRAILRSNNLEETFDRYYEDRMKTWIRDAYSRLQEAEFTRQQDEGYSAVTHQKFVGTGYFDQVAQTIAGQASSTAALKGSTEEEQFTPATVDSRLAAALPAND